MSLALVVAGVWFGGLFLVLASLVGRVVWDELYCLAFHRRLTTSLYVRGAVVARRCHVRGCRAQARENTRLLEQLVDSMPAESRR